MARQSPAQHVWRSEERSRDRERARFLVLMDEIAPHVWKELVDAGTSRDILAWALRHHLYDWVVPYARDRIERCDTSNRGRRGWLRIDRGSVHGIPESGVSSPVWDPATMPLQAWKRKVAEYQKRVEAAALRAGLQPKGEIEERHLRWFVGWQILGESPETIAKRELGIATVVRAGAREVQRIKTRAEDIRDTVKKLGARLEIPARPRGRAGHPPLRATQQVKQASQVVRPASSGWAGSRRTRATTRKYPDAPADEELAPVTASLRSIWRSLSEQGLSRR
jgi:hypothetical protein